MQKDTFNDAHCGSSTGVHTLGTALVVAAISFAMPGQAQAEAAPERGLVSLKYLDYLDSQPGDDRIKVRATALRLMTPIAGEWSVDGTVTSDSISGASPAYHTYALTKMQDVRHAADASLTRYLENGTVTVGANISSESDYLSRGLSFQGSHSTADKNTTFTAGFGYTSDVINPTNHVVDHETKQRADFLLGVTQVMSVNDIVQFSLGYVRGRGYFSDPYKVFDERPRTRNNTTLVGRWNHHVESTQGTMRLNYRYYSDSWNIKGHTLGLEYVQPLGNGWAIMPLLRVYSQSAARFYVESDPSTAPFPPNPPAGAIYSSEDQRVSAFGAHTFGLKVSKQLNADWLLDVKLEQYGQRAAWRLFGEGSPGLADFNARSIQLGISRQL